MSTTYSGNDGNNPTSITIPSDGDDADASSVTPAFEGLMDKVCYAITGDTGFTGAKIFGGPVEFSAEVVHQKGANFASGELDDVDDPIVHVECASTVVRQVMSIGESGAGRAKARVYVSTSGGDAETYQITTNARWESADSKWYADDTAAPARSWLLSFSSTQGPTVTMREKQTTATEWANNAWDSLTLAVAPGNPTATAASLPTNTLFSKSVDKAFGRISVTGGVASIVGGLGLASVSVGGGTVLVTLRNAMANTDYSVLPTPSDASAIPRVQSIVSTTQFRLEWRDYAGVAVDPAAVDVSCNFIVKGEQA